MSGKLARQLAAAAAALTFPIPGMCARTTLWRPTTPVFGRTVKRPEPGPVIVTLSVIDSCEARLIVRAVAKKVGSKPIVSTVFAALVSRIAWRSEPAPASLALVTTRLNEINVRNEPTGVCGTGVAPTVMTWVASTVAVYVPLSAASHEPPGGVKL